MKYLIDTNIISELRRKQPNPNVMQWFDAVELDHLYLSCITIGELKSGALKKSKRDQTAGHALEKWIDCLISNYSDRILEINLQTCETWGEMLSIDSTNAIDALIAAQTVQSEMILVTRNTKHFDLFKIKLLNPFDYTG